MHSFIVVSKNKEAALNYVKVECKKNQIDKFDVALFTFQKAIGIEDIRNCQKKIFLKPIKSKIKAIILEAYNGITTPAQNALLKLLEEPPANTIIYIISANKELFLPTILSRCKVIELKDKSFEQSEQEVAQYLNLLISFPQKPIGERLKLAQDISKNKDEVSLWLEEMIIVARKKLTDSIYHSGKTKRSFANAQDDNLQTAQCLNILKSLQKAHTIISTTNANQRLVLENLFLNL